MTDPKGQFHFSDAGQIIRIETSQYRPIGKVVALGGAPVTIKLEEARASDWLVPVCSDDSKNRIGFKALISLPSTMSAEYYKDDGDPAYFVFPKGSSAPEAELVVGQYSEDVGDSRAGRNSAWFSQRWIKDSSGNIVGIDSRGRSRDGIYYRAATFGQHETIGYGLNRKNENPAQLNKIIDTLCTVPD